MEAGIYVTKETHDGMPVEALAVLQEPAQCVLFIRMLYPPDVTVQLHEQGASMHHLHLEMNLN